MSEHRTRQARQAGIDLQDTESNRAVIEGIIEDNPNASVDHMPGLVRIRTEGPLRVERTTVEKHMGGESWDPEDIQLAIVSMAGNLDIEEDYIEIAWRH
jgi:phenol hydroxylase P2 protein